MKTEAFWDHTVGKTLGPTNEYVSKMLLFIQPTFLNADIENELMKEGVRRQCCLVLFSTTEHRFVQHGYNFQLDIRDVRVPQEWLNKKHKGLAPCTTWGGERIRNFRKFCLTTIIQNTGSHDHY